MSIFLYFTHTGNTPAKSVASCIAGLLLLYFSSSFAQEVRVVTVQANDTLSEIAAQAYPDLSDRRAVMQRILAQNPDAFINNDINQLIIGKTLSLPDTTRTATAETSITRPPRNTATGTVPPADSITDKTTTPATRPLEQSQQTLLQQLEEMQQKNQALSDKLDELEQRNAEQDKALQESTQQLEQLQLNQQEQNNPSTPADTEVETEADKGTEAIDPAEHQSLQEAVRQLRNTTEQQSRRQTALLAEIADLKKDQQTLQTENTSLTQQLTTRTQQPTQTGGLPQWLEHLQQSGGLWPWLAALGLLCLLPLSWWLGAKSQAKKTPYIRKTDTTLSELPTTAPVLGTASKRSENVATPAHTGDISNFSKQSTPQPQPTDASTTVVKTLLPENLPQPPLEDTTDVSLKLAIAHAYLDLRKPDSTKEILEDVLKQGNPQQQQEAREILSFIN